MTALLEFSRDRCGHAYKFSKNLIGYYDCKFYDWKTGWIDCYEIELAAFGSPKTYDEAVKLCTAHAKRHGWYKYLPHQREKTVLELMSGMIAGVAMSL